MVSGALFEALSCSSDRTGNDRTGNNPNAGFRRLAAQVLLQALRDARFMRVMTAGGIIVDLTLAYNPRKLKNQRARDTEQARRFLTRPSQMLSLWCAWLDLNVDLLVEACRGVHEQAVVAERSEARRRRRRRRRRKQEQTRDQRQEGIRDGEADEHGTGQPGSASSVDRQASQSP